MSEPKLLIALTPSEAATAQVRSVFPDVPWAYASDVRSRPWTTVRAMLVGSLDRELPGFKPEMVPRLEIVQTIYTGVDAFPFERFRPGVAVCANVGGYAPFVAEHALALSLALARGIPEGMGSVAEGRLRPAPEARTFVGKRALILGFGAIAKELAPRLRALGLELEGLSRSGTEEPGAVRMFPASKLIEAVGRADLIVEIRPLTRATRGTLGAREFAAMRDDAIFVNVGRAETVDEGALYEHLRAHPRFRAGFDVFWEEAFGDGKLEFRFPFPSLANFLGSPHCAAAVPEARPYALERALSNLRRFFDGTLALYRVDRREYERADVSGVASGTR
ncbi:MAG: hypothetical protein L3K09_03960 [Thermoplasmata archaeon]|nr:hypothetical protein [Thermoplasmata archaeon]